MSISTFDTAPEPASAPTTDATTATTRLRAVTRRPGVSASTVPIADDSGPSETRGRLGAVTGEPGEPDGRGEPGGTASDVPSADDSGPSETGGRLHAVPARPSSSAPAVPSGDGSGSSAAESGRPESDRERSGTRRTIRRARRGGSPVTAPARGDGHGDGHGDVHGDSDGDGDGRGTARALLRDDSGMSTVEYAIGTVAAAAFAAILYAVVSGDTILTALTDIVQRALSTTF